MASKWTCWAEQIFLNWLSRRIYQGGRRSTCTSVFPWRLKTQFSYYMQELALDNSEIIQSFSLCIRYFKAVRLSNHSVPARSKLFAAISVMEIIIVFTINMINMYERPGSIVSLNLWVLQNSSPEVVGHHAGTPLVIPHGRWLQFKEAQLWKSAKSLGVEKGIQQFHSHRMWPQFKTLPKAQFD